MQDFYQQDDDHSHQIQTEYVEEMDEAEEDVVELTEKMFILF